MTIRSITPFLWFNTEAEDAANFYVSLFPNAKIMNVSRYGDAGPAQKGSAMVVGFEIAGQRLVALNGGPNFRLDEAFSLLVDCTEQEDIDRLWSALGEGGSYSVCGWLKDRFGLSWQINYAGLPDLISGANGGKVMAAIMGMTKVDIQALKDAGAGSQT
ncbi:VOC family protein [Hyphomicrobium sp.]|uniref:VOC family protein n=1 Tax=Hyphomicrobium sp. TaxID=82 RepID=UPI001D69505E|nr:VOC family protein [Hyphomicrobium sp.]MBY0561661.1 VOC family protein [Hyphomicrobium sp.]